MRPNRRYRDADYAQMVDDYNDQQDRRQAPRPPRSPLPSLRPQSADEQDEISMQKARNRAALQLEPRAPDVSNERWADAMVLVQRMEVRLAVQDRSVAELREEVRGLKRLRQIEARAADPAHAAVLSVASRQATDEQRLEEVFSLVRAHESQLRYLERGTEAVADGGERRLTALESQLRPGVGPLARLAQAHAETRDEAAALRATTISQSMALDTLRAELQDVGRRAFSGEQSAKQLRGIVEQQARELRLIIGGEAAEASRAVQDEAEARAGLGFALERRSVALVQAVERRGKEAISKVSSDVVEVRQDLNKERADRRVAVESTLDLLEDRWTALGKMRADEADAKRHEAEALRTALAVVMRDMQRRVDDFEDVVKKREDDGDAATAAALDKADDRSKQLFARWAEKAAELEQVLSSEIAARRSNFHALGARQLELEDSARADLVNATNRLGTLVTRVDETLSKGLRVCAEQLAKVEGEAYARTKRLAQRTEAQLSMLWDAIDANAASTAAARALDRTDQAASEDFSTRRFVAAEQATAERFQKAAERGEALQRQADAHRTEARKSLAAVQAALQEDLAEQARSSAAEQAANVDALRDALRNVDVAVRADLSAAAEEAATTQKREAAEASDRAQGRLDGVKAELEAADAASKAAAAALGDRVDRDVAAASAKLREDALKQVEACNALARDLFSKEERDRKATAAVATALMSAAYAAADVAARDDVRRDADAMRLTLEASDADLRASIIAEGRAARATARALTDAEASERRHAAAALAAQTLALVEATAATVTAKAEALNAATDAKFDQKSAAETAHRLALGAHLRREAASKSEADDRHRECAAALQQVVSDCVDRDSLDARRRLAREVDSSDRCSKSRDAALGALLKAEEATREADDEAERLSRMGALDELDQALQNESSARLEADADLSDALAEAREALSAELFAEKVERVENDEALTNRAAVAASLKAAIDSVADRLHDDRALEDEMALAAEVGARLAATQKLGDDVKAEKEARQRIEGVLADGLKKEVEDRRAAVDAESVSRKEQCDKVSADLSEESTERKLQSDALQTELHDAASFLRGVHDDYARRQLVERCLADVCAQVSETTSRSSLHDAIKASNAASIKTAKALQAALERQTLELIDEAAARKTECASLTTAAADLEAHLELSLVQQKVESDTLLEKTKAATNAALVQITTETDAALADHKTEWAAAHASTDAAVDALRASAAEAKTAADAEVEARLAESAASQKSTGEAVESLRAGAVEAKTAADAETEARLAESAAQADARVELAAQMASTAEDLERLVAATEAKAAVSVSAVRGELDAHAALALKKVAALDEQAALAMEKIANLRRGLVHVDGKIAAVEAKIAGAPAAQKTATPAVPAPAPGKAGVMEALATPR